MPAETDLTPTPRTDAFLRDRYYADEHKQFSDVRELIQHARQLERELAARPSRGVEDLKAFSWQMESDHVTAGSPGPLYGAGWSAACKLWARKLRELSATPTPEREADGWVSVSERLPDFQTMVLLHSPESQRAAVQYGYCGFGSAGRLGGQDWFVHTAMGWEPATYTGKPVTHWMPLPSPPAATPSAGER